METPPMTASDVRMLALNYGLMLAIVKPPEPELATALEQVRQLKALAGWMERTTERRA